MRRMFHAVVAALLLSTPTFAQYGPYMYPQSGAYFGAYAGPWYGYVPGAYNGFWSNGFSLYGPPVPTYGSIPGVFGGSDQKLSNYPDMNAVFANPYGWRGGYVPLNPPVKYFMVAPVAVCEIRLPEPDAEVSINGTVLQGAGSVRTFQTEVMPGVGSNCEIEAKWAGATSIGQGKRSVVLRAGETAVADFTKAGQ
jgi:uncharacterized protein (TIGR03000 family)